MTDQITRWFRWLKCKKLRVGNSDPKRGAGDDEVLNMFKESYGIWIEHLKTN